MPDESAALSVTPRRQVPQSPFCVAQSSERTPDRSLYTQTRILGLACLRTGMRRKSQELRTTIEFLRAILAHCAFVVARTAASSSHRLNALTGTLRGRRPGAAGERGARPEAAPIADRVTTSPVSKTAIQLA